MFVLCKKNFSRCPVLNFIQQFFCVMKKHAHTVHKRILHHTYKRRHNRLSYIHVILLLLFFYFYNITSYHQGQEIDVAPSETPIVIENEPQIVPEQVPTEQSQPEIVPIETMS